MTWAAIAVTAVSAGTAAYGASQKNKQAKGVMAGFDDAASFAAANPGAFGEKIDFKAIKYSPLFKSDPGYGNIAGQTIAGNQRNLPGNLQLMRETNQAITDDALTRMDQLYPGLKGQFGQQSRNTSNLLRGDLPFEDQNAITSRRSEAISLGGGGATQQQVAADLGLSRMDAMQQGAVNMTNNVNLWNTIDPISRRVNPQSLFVDVGEAINSSVAENKFKAQFDASERDTKINYAMMPDPRLAGQLNLMTARSGAQAANPTTSVLGSAIVAGANSAVGAYQSNQAQASWNQQQAAPAYVSAPAQRPYYASASDQANGFQAFSGGTTPTTAYNPQTGTGYGQQGGLWSYFTQPNTNKNRGY